MPLSDDEAAIVQAVASDEELSRRARGIADKMLRKIERIVDTGTDPAVLGLASKMMPALMKAMNDRGGDDELRAIFEELREEMRGHAPPVVEEELTEANEDVPPIVIGAPKQQKPPAIRVSTKAMRDRTPTKNTAPKP